MILASCAEGTSRPSNEPHACAMQREIATPARRVQNMLLVPVRLSGHPTQFQVDTGAQRSMVTSDIVTRLGLPPDPHNQTVMHGTGGSADLTRNTMVGIQIGNSEWGNFSLSTGRLASRLVMDPPLGGLLGADLLGRFDVELDLPHGVMGFWTVHFCDGDFVPLKQPHYILPLRPRLNRTFVTTVEIDHQPVVALVDWGAQSSVLKSATAERLGITEAMLAHDFSGTTRGINDRERSVRRHQVGEVRIGPEVFHNVALTVGNIELDNADMLLGMDFFSARHLWLSYSTRQLFVEPPERPGTTPPEMVR